MALMYPGVWVDEVLSRADIVDVVSAYLPLKRQGRNYIGLCPFHNEKTPSFSVNRENNVYHCFGCKAGGNVAQFVMEMEKLTFPESLRHLAKLLNISEPVQAYDPRAEQERSQKERVYDANKDAALYFNANLYNPQGKKVLDYLYRRGIDDAMIKRFGLGASSDEWSGLKDYLNQKGYTQDELAASGLIHVRQGNSYDVFRDRAIFPIIDLYGKTIGFGARAMGDAQPKYLNTQDTIIFNKRYGLYGANYLRKQRDLKRVILVEGYMDVMALSQVGIQGAVATLGTALSPQQARLMKRLASEVWVCYDGDEAGQMAIMRALEVLDAEAIPSRVLHLPQGLDPDDYLKRYGADAFEELKPITANTYRLLRLKIGFDLSSEDENSAFSLEACELISKVASPLEREDLVRWLTAETGYPKDVLTQQVEQLLRKLGPKSAAGLKSSLGKSRRNGVEMSLDEAEKTLLRLMATGHVPNDFMNEDDFESATIAKLFKALSEGQKPMKILTDCDDNQTRSIASEAFSMTDSIDIEQVLPAAEECLTVLRKKKISQRIDAISQNLSNLTGEQKISSLEEIMRLRKTLNSLKISQAEGKEIS
ncbi:MAG: DNA primase [Clostridiales bacterium]|nr:DNA primase [Clostridiales bacterium]